MTPFDTALRLYRRQIDAIKVSITVEMERISTLTARTEAHEVVWREEQAAARALPFASDAWAARMRQERSRIDAARSEAQTRLEQLRRDASAAYGTMRSIETAAERWQDDATRTAALAEQAGIDDLSAARAARYEPRGRLA
ncbi:hypothetical protein [uncultured Sphingomonas sp.]|uniref:hypothetical protein n=1 Tax=uncultured Sphingomonas sp. TaxID=158754 RepID=UPI0026368E93|nr:hypothetical protein [uncultured Sphingomonas sp.]